MMIIDINLENYLKSIKLKGIDVTPAQQYLDNIISPACRQQLEEASQGAVSVPQSVHALCKSNCD